MLNIFRSFYTSDKSNLIYLVLIVFLLNLIFIFQGLDVTDLGYNLSNQILSLNPAANLSSIAPLWFLTDFILGIWLSISGGPNLIWARLAGVILVTINAAIIYTILANYFEKKKTFLIVLATTIFISILVRVNIDYQTFPPLLINLGLLIFNGILLTPANSKKYKLMSYGLGFLLVPIVLSRFTLLSVVVIPIAILLYVYAKEKNLLRLKPAFPGLFLGLLTSIAVFSFLYWRLGILDYYLSYFFNAVFGSLTGNMTNVSINNTHSMSKLLLVYINDLFSVAKCIFLLLLAVLVLNFLMKKIKQKTNNYSIYLLAIPALIYFIVLTDSSEVLALFRHFICILFGFILVISTVYLIGNHKSNLNITLLLITGLLIMTITPVGSDIGIINTPNGMWLVLPLSILSFHNVTGKIRNIKASNYIPLVSLAVVIILMVSLFYTVTFIYRDSPDRFALNTEFKDPSLRLIFSTPDRVNAVDELIAEVHKRTNNGDDVLFVNNIPMFYYLTGTRPALGTTWLFIEDLEHIKKEQQDLEAENDLPELVIYSKVDTANANWPDVNVTSVGKDTEKLDYLKDEYVNHLNYKLTWENNAFEVYEPSNES